MTAMHITVLIKPGEIHVTGTAFAIGPRVDEEDAMAQKISDAFTEALKKLSDPDGVVVMITQDYPKDEHGNTIKPESTPNRRSKGNRLD